MNNLLLCSILIAIVFNAWLIQAKLEEIYQELRKLNENSIQITGVKPQVERPYVDLTQPDGRTERIHL